MREIALGRIVDKETGPACEYRDKFAGKLFGDGGAAKGGTHHTVLLEDAIADIRSAMDDDAAFGGEGIIASVETIEAKGQAILAVVGVAGDIEAEAAFMRFGCIGERAGEFTSGADAMGDIVTAQKFFCVEIDDVHAFLAGRLAEVADGEDVGVLDLIPFEEAMVPYECVLQHFLVETFIGELQVFV